MADDRDMIVVRVEHWPKGEMRRARELERVRITAAAEPQDDSGVGDYHVEILGIVGRDPVPGAVTKTCRVNGFSRQGRTTLDLLYCGLRDLVGTRNEEQIPPAAE